jgi:excisionase family DNA binding protein
MPIDTSQFLTTDDVAKRTGLSRTSVQKYIKMGALKTIMYKRRYYISEEALLAFKEFRESGGKLSHDGQSTGTYSTGRDEPYQGKNQWHVLALAIVNQVRKDYRSLLRKKDEANILAMEKILTSEWIEFLTMGEGNMERFIDQEKRKYGQEKSDDDRAGKCEIPS